MTLMRANRDITASFQDANKEEKWAVPHHITGAKAPAYCHRVPLGRDDMA